MDGIQLNRGESFFKQKYACDVRVILLKKLNLIDVKNLRNRDLCA